MSFPKSTKMFYKRDTRAKNRGAELIGLSLKRSGQPSDHSKPPVMQDFNKRKIAEAAKAAREAERGTLKDQSATNSDPVTKHFAPKKGN